MPCILKYRNILQKYPPHMPCILLAIQVSACSRSATHFSLSPALISTPPSALPAASPRESPCSGTYCRPAFALFGKCLRKTEDPHPPKHADNIHLQAHLIFIFSDRTPLDNVQPPSVLPMHFQPQHMYLPEPPCMCALSAVGPSRVRPWCTGSTGPTTSSRRQAWPTSASSLSSPLSSSSPTSRPPTRTGWSGPWTLA